MSELKKKLDSQLISAAKSKDKLRLSTLRMVKSSIKYKEIENKDELSEPEIIQVLSTMAKQRIESVKAFRDGDREELAQKEEAELKILKEFLPVQLSKDEIAEKAKEVIKKIGAASERDIGKVMKEIMPLLSGRAQGKEVSLIVKDMLSS